MCVNDTWYTIIIDVYVTAFKSFNANDTFVFGCILDETELLLAFNHIQKFDRMRTFVCKHWAMDDITDGIDAEKNKYFFFV